MEASTNKRGGRRTGAGSKLKYGEPTINITFRIPQSKKDQIKAMVKKYLSTMTANSNSTAQSNAN
jgi:hypothetical protein